VLEDKRAALLETLRTRDGIAIEASADQMDLTRGAYERDLAIRSADRGSNLLRDVNAALQRTRDGCFGTCVECDEPISAKRLAAVPWASRCIGCQEIAEQPSQDTTTGLGENFENAA
jgi:DnaK suppressor protein